jgi:hypothetical protein
LYLVATLDPDVVWQELEDKFRSAIKDDPQLRCDLANIDVKPIDASHYQFLMKLIRLPLSAGGLASDVAIMVDEQSSAGWILSFGSQYFDLSRIMIDGTREGKAESLEFAGDEIGGVGETDKVVSLRLPGYYYVRLPDNFSPQKYSATVVDVREPGAQNVLNGTWPARGTYCLIEIPGFEGDRRHLKQVLEDPDRVGEPITMSEVIETISLFHAQIGEKLPGNTESFDKQFLHVKYLKPENRSPKRVWMKFPMTEEEARQTVSKWVGQDGTWKAGGKISADIRADALVQLPADWNPANKKLPIYKIAPEDGPRWYELPAIQDEKQQYFGGAWEFVNVSDWKSAKAPRDWRVYVFEFERGGEMEAVKVMHPAKQVTVRAVDEPLYIWTTFVSQLDAEEKQP